MLPEERTAADSLVVFEIGEADKGQLVPDVGLRSGERFHVALVVFDLVEIAGVYVTAQLWDHRGDG